ncbi:MAG: KdsC family phosphatase [Thermodesulfobacteriota bacterium]
MSPREVLPDADALKADALKKVRLLLLDVDGVLTDGTIIYNEDGSETKRFHVRDGLGIRLLMEAGIGVAIVTGRSSRALHHRCRNLGIEAIYDGVEDKGALISRIEVRTGVSPDEMAFVGDDLPDLPLMRRVGISVAVADGHPAVREAADMTTAAPGGKGAVREVCEAILKARGFWEKMKGKF